MSNIVKYINSQSIGTFNTIKKFVTKIIKEESPSEYTILRYIENQAEEDIVSYLKKSKLIRKYFNFNFYEYIKACPPKVAIEIANLLPEKRIFFYANHHYLNLKKTYYKLPLIKQYQIEEEDNFFKIYKEFRKQGKNNIRLLEENNLKKLFEIKEVLKENIDHLMLEIEKNIKSEKELFDYIKNIPEEAKVYKVENKSIQERMIENHTINLIEDPNIISYFYDLSKLNDFEFYKENKRLYSLFNDRLIENLIIKYDFNIEKLLIKDSFNLKNINIKNKRL